MKTIGIIGAMPSEVDHLTARLTQSTVTAIAGRRFVQGQLGKHTAVVVESGIGKVNAAITAQLLIDRFAPDALLNTGMAGGLAPELAVKDLVIGTEAVQHDFDITAFGHAPGYMGTGGDDQQPTVFAADPTLAAAAARAAQRVLPAGSRAIPGRIASGDVFVDDSALKQRIRSQFGAAAAEMEGAAIAQTAAANGVPFLILRTISDLAEHQASVSFDELERYVGQLAGDITGALLEEI